MFFARLLRKLEDAGEEFTVNGHSHFGAFRLLDSGTLRTYLDDVEVMGVVKPALLLVTTPDCAMNINDVITRDGRDYKVLKFYTSRIAGAAVARVAILS